MRQKEQQRMMGGKEARFEVKQPTTAFVFKDSLPAGCDTGRGAILFVLGRDWKYIHTWHHLKVSKLSASKKSHPTSSE